MKNIFLTVLLLYVISACDSAIISEEEKFIISSGGTINGFDKFQIKSADGVLFNFYIDNAGRLVQISDSTTEKYRIVFSDNEQIQLVENKCFNNRKRIYEFDNLKDIISISDESDKMLRELRVFNIGSKAPSIDYSLSRVDDDLYFLSDYSSFDFVRWNDPSPDSRENIVLIEEPKEVFQNENNLWQFKLYSKGNKNRLLKSKYDANFDTKMKIDTFLVNQTFTYEYNPNTVEDTIRFIIISEDTKDGMLKSFYYQLPIRSVIR